MVVRDPEVETLTRESIRLIARAELVYEDLVSLQNQIQVFLTRANALAERTERVLKEKS